MVALMWLTLTRARWTCIDSPDTTWMIWGVIKRHPGVAKCKGKWYFPLKNKLVWRGTCGDRGCPLFTLIFKWIAGNEDQNVITWNIKQTQKNNEYSFKSFSWWIWQIQPYKCYARSDILVLEVLITESVLLYCRDTSWHFLSHARYFDSCTGSRYMGTMTCTAARPVQLLNCTV